MLRIFLDVLIMAVLATTVWYVYTTYGDQIVDYWFGYQPETIYIDNLAIAVSIADDEIEREQGLSGVTELGELQGKLFIFDASDTYGMWMKDMQIPLDILWVNDQYEVVHIEENLTPDTYPKIFRSPVPARMVLEVNAFFVNSFGIKVGDRLTIPAGLLPKDLKEQLLIDSGLQTS